MGKKFICLRGAKAEDEEIKEKFFARNFLYLYLPALSHDDNIMVIITSSSGGGAFPCIFLQMTGFPIFSLFAARCRVNIRDENRVCWGKETWNRQCNIHKPNTSLFSQQQQKIQVVTTGCCFCCEKKIRFSELVGSRRHACQKTGWSEKCCCAFTRHRNSRGLSL